MSVEHLYLIAYDIASPRRWRRVFKLMNGYGDWLQLSVFQCRLSAMRHRELIAKLTGVIVPAEDHVIIIDIGAAESVSAKVTSIGRRGYEPLGREAVIV